MSLVVQSKTNSGSVITKVKETLSVEADGTIKFRTRSGKGSGKGVEIPSDQFDEFMSLMKQANEKRQEVLSANNDAAEEPAEEDDDE